MTFEVAYKWTRRVMLSLCVIGVISAFAIGCGSAVGSSRNRDRHLDDVQVIAVQNGTIVAIIDDYHIYRFKDGVYTCYFAFEPGVGDNSISCLP